VKSSKSRKVSFASPTKLDTIHESDIESNSEVETPREKIKLELGDYSPTPSEERRAEEMLSFFNGDGNRLPDFVVKQQRQSMFHSKIEKLKQKQKSKQEATVKVDAFKASMLEKIK
jgi:hypothetical protein